jgi:hypothetical protein
MKIYFRKALLASHITFSAGWLGAVAVFLVLATTALKSDNSLLVRSCLISMELSAWCIIVPFCLTSFVTGVVQALVTKWGLFKHYWIIVKLILTLASTILLLFHMGPINDLANDAKSSLFSKSQQTENIINLISKSGAAIFALLVITTISIYKPWGKIQLTQRYNNNLQINPQSTSTFKKNIRLYGIIGLVILLVIIIIKHLLGGHMSQH